MYALAIFAAVIAALLLLRIRGFIEYSNAGFSGYLSILFFKIRFPMSKKPKKAPEEKEEAHAQQKKDGGSAKDFFKVIKPLLHAAGKVIRTIKINNLDISIKIASGDAFNTAMMYGGAAAAVGMIFPWIENNLKVKKRTIKVDADFESEETTVFCAAKLSIAIWQILVIAVSIAYQLAKVQIINSKRKSKIKEGNGH